MVLSRRELGQKIKEARLKKAKESNKKYTQEMLSSDVGISRSYLGDIEAGRKYPNYVLLSKIAEVCGVSVESLTSDNKEIISVDNFSAYFYDGNNKDELTENEVLALKAYLLLYRQQKQSKEGE